MQVESKRGGQLCECGCGGCVRGGSLRFIHGHNRAKPLTQEKACTKCGDIKPIEQFCIDRSVRSGRHPVCKACEVKRVRAWREAHPDYVSRHVRDLRANGLARYGLTVEAYDQLLQAQRGLCAICGKACTTGQALSVDHEHATGRIRGLLCKKCNMAIGLLNDSPERLEAAKVYLLR
jgi:hypothetical protein